MPKKVLVATEKPFAKVAVAGISEIFREAGYEMTLLESYKDKADYLKAVAGAEGLIVRSDIVDADVLKAAPNLKIVVRAGAGYDNIDLKAASGAGRRRHEHARPELERRRRARVRADAHAGPPGLQRQGRHGAAREEDRHPRVRERREVRRRWSPGGSGWTSSRSIPTCRPRR